MGTEVISPTDAMFNPHLSGAVSPQGFIEEIVYEEINFGKVVGRGAFGIVHKALWKGHLVAVKTIEGEAEAKALKDEVQQLSIVSHPNIIKLFGTCPRKPKVCLVMEYAEGGSLYDVLHPSDQVPRPCSYSIGHLMSWALQCSKAMEYLHGLKPHAIIHRDLKPPNMLLTKCGTVLKICDFGTACYLRTNMTSNRGSAAWMAPEVFEGVMYSEKCDVYSFGIVLWEMITRKKPFEEIGPPAFRIMWAVHSGKRPPLIRGIPKLLEQLMVSCWHKETKYRPPFAQIVTFLEKASEFVSGGDVPLITPRSSVGESANTLSSSSSSFASTMLTDPFSKTSEARTSIPLKDSVKEANAKPLEEKPETATIDEEREEVDEIPVEVDKEEVDKEEVDKGEVHKEEVHKEEVHKEKVHKEEVDKEVVDKEEVHKEELHKEEVDRVEVDKEEVDKLEAKQLKPDVFIAPSMVPKAIPVAPKRPPLDHQDSLEVAEIYYPSTIIPNRKFSDDKQSTISRSRPASGELTSPSVTGANRFKPGEERNTPYQPSPARQLEFEGGNRRDHTQNLTNSVQRSLEYLDISDRSLPQPNVAGYEYQPVELPALPVISPGQNPFVSGKRSSIDESLSGPRFDQQQYVKPRFSQPLFDQTRFEQPQFDQTRFEQPQFDQTRFEQPQFDQTRFEQPQFDQTRFEQPQFDQTRFEQPQFDQTRFEQPRFELPRFDQPRSHQPRFDKPPAYLVGFEQPQFNQPEVHQPPYAERYSHPGPLVSPLNRDVDLISPISGQGVHLNHLQGVSPQQGMSFDANTSFPIDYKPPYARQNASQHSLSGNRPYFVSTPGDFVSQYSEPGTSQNQFNPGVNLTSPAENTLASQRKPSPTSSQSNMYMNQQLAYQQQISLTPSPSSQRSPHRSPTWPGNPRPTMIPEDEYQPQTPWAQPYPQYTPPTQALYQLNNFNPNSSHAKNSGQSLFTPLSVDNMQHSNHSNYSSSNSSPMTSPYGAAKAEALRPPNEIHRALSHPSPPRQQDMRAQLKKHFSESDNLDQRLWHLLEPDLMPVKPTRDNDVSVSIYKQHVSLVDEYIKHQKELEYLLERKHDLKQKLDEEKIEQQRNSMYLEDYLKLQEEKQSLSLYLGSVKNELEREKISRSSGENFL